MVKIKIILTKILLLFSIFIASSFAYADNSEFVISDIRLEGLQRVSASQIFSAIDLNVGDRLNSNKISKGIKQIFATGFFDKVEMFRDKNVLVVKLAERPIIDSIEIEGNKKIPTEQLELGLKSSGLKEGDVFTRSSLELIRKELVRVYNMQGRYSASIDASAEELSRNRVALKLKVNEGTVASIKRINIVGNRAFDNQTLLDELELKEDYSWNFLSSAHEYSKERMVGDLEKIQSWYFNHGYIKAKIVGSDVSVSPNKQDIYISITVEEGEQYKVSDIKLAGDLILDEEDIFKGIVLKKDETFSRELLTFSNKNIEKMLGNKGYTYAQVQETLVPNDLDKTVAITLNLNPGKRFYVRRINIVGNVSTQDEVLRRQLVQIEGGWASTEKIQAAKANLMRLGFFKTVDISTNRVAGVDDQIDVTVKVEEQSSGQISLNLGYSVSQGLLIGGKLKQSNFLGTGNDFSIDGSISIDLSSSEKYKKIKNKNRISKGSLYLSYFEPYYTIDGVSRGVTTYYNYTNFDALYLDGENSLGKFSTNSGGISLRFGHPLNSLNYLSYSVGFDYTYVYPVKYAGEYNYKEVGDFVTKHGQHFPNYQFDITWTRNTLNKGILPTDGSLHTFNINLGGTFKYDWFKATYQLRQFWEFAPNWSVLFKTKLGYGRGFRKNDSLPIFTKYYAGGLGSVRGYSGGSLGPDLTKSSGEYKGAKVNDTLGGDIVFETSLALIFPVPFVKDQSMFQPSIFFDVGSVFTESSIITKNAWENIGYSLGFSFTWITPMAPITFSLAYPLGNYINAKAGKKTGIGDPEYFQFTMGTVL